MQTLPLILASSSPYRRELLNRLGLDFTCFSPDIDETSIDGEKPEELALRLSTEKAHAMTSSCPDHLVIGSDQVITTWDGTILGKPGNHETAVSQLKCVSGKSVSLITGVALLNTQSGHLQVDCVCYEVGYRILSDSMIENYLQREQPYDCAGSLKSEGLGISLLTFLRGDDPSAIIGLPLITLSTMLHNEGVVL